ncbi:replication protein A 70 kDa DNA-binding subunit D-like [Rhododendron vialii]|uniref:replication protein A 70 kDa DNA-binding subunit D-like n=1 Tax=Rhododendron vialii TaxID=182163 RepID=UPI0026601D44|nr:replication protein A 70 kDa DNA-binding subunit D-like [Rhododendron vialii]XP_058201031.1 replication protein A 70 kDa DNA-binding subunit D-like [Rhododendron vialii]
MAPNIIPLKDVTLTSKNYTIQAMVIEKNIPRMSRTSSSLYQRIMLQDKEENKIQATIFGYNIRILESSLKLYHTYFITNAGVTATPEIFRVLENKNQLAINARTPVEEMQIDGLTMRTIKYNFTPIAAL